MALKIIMLVIFFAIMIGVGFYAKQHTKDVKGFVLGGRSVGPWLTAFAYGTSYFPPLFLSAMPVSSAGSSVLPLPGSVSVTP